MSYMRRECFGGKCFDGWFGKMKNLTEMTEERQIRQTMNAIKGRLNVQEIHNSWDMLQLADVCATTTFLAHEINGWGFRTPCYFMVLQNHLYRHGGKVMSYGMKYFTDEMKPDKAKIQSDYPCKRKERASGATSTD